MENIPKGQIDAQLLGIFVCAVRYRFHLLFQRPWNTGWFRARRFESFDRCRRALWRKVLGGGMRQSGLLAAACLFALDHHVESLARDHENAACLAEGLRAIEQIKVQAHATNMVFAKIPQAHCAPLEAFLKERRILTQMLYASRFVIHRDVSREDIDTVVRAVKEYFAR